MSLFDFFFPEQAQAAHLRRLADQQRSSRSTERPARAEVAQLEKRITDLAQAMRNLDSIDGVADGRLDIKILRGMHR